MFRRNAEDHILQRCKSLYEHKMLVNHANSKLDGFRGGIDLNRLTVDEDLTAIRLMKPIEDVHQGGLAGAVLSEQSENLAFPAIETDPIVSQDSRKTFCDLLHAHYDFIILCHKQFLYPYQGLAQLGLNPIPKDHALLVGRIRDSIRSHEQWVARKRHPLLR